MQQVDYYPSPAMQLRSSSQMQPGRDITRLKLSQASEATHLA